MAVIWEVIDRLGRTVVLTDEAWQHLCAEHDYMAQRSDEVKKAVTHADAVVRDRAFTHRAIHYHSRSSGAVWLRVVVQYRPIQPNGWTGEIVTAHFISRRYRGEAPLWPSGSTR